MSSRTYCIISAWAITRSMVAARSPSSRQRGLGVGDRRVGHQGQRFGGRTAVAQGVTEGEPRLAVGVGAERGSRQTARGVIVAASIGRRGRGDRQLRQRHHAVVERPAARSQHQAVGHGRITGDRR